MSKIWVVARREYLSTVRRKAFIITTIGMPLFFVVIYGIAGGAAFFAIRANRNKTETVGVVDKSGILNFELLPQLEAQSRKAAASDENTLGLAKRRGMDSLPGQGENIQIRSFSTEAEATAAFTRKDIRGYYLLPENFVSTGEVRLRIKKGTFMSDSSPGWGAIRRLIQASLVQDKMDKVTAARVWMPPALKTEALLDSGAPDKRGEYAELMSFAVPYAFGLLFMLSVLSSGGYLLQSVVEEKENRVIEILLSSVTTDELLAGKILGLGAAGLTQIAVWVLIGITPSLYLIPFLELRWSQLFVAVVFFILGFLLVGTMMAGSGAFGNNFRESQQAAMVWTLMSVIPFFFMTVILSQPNGTLAHVLSYIPLTAAITMMLRIGATTVPWWDIALSAGILAASLFLFLRLGAKLFRLGSLMYGKKPSVVEIVRWLRAS